MGWVLGLAIGVGWLTYKSLTLLAQFLWLMLKGLIWVIVACVAFFIAVFTSPTPGRASSSTRAETEPTTPPSDSAPRTPRRKRTSKR